VNAETGGDIPHIDGDRSPDAEIATGHFPQGHQGDRHPMRSDIRPGGVFPAYSLPGRTGTVRRGRLHS
jgi:hypothetical protein